MTDGIEYSIAAIPTRYRGRQYRSRLEARWAAFFDLLGFQAEYEPYDLGRWSPDFLLVGPYGDKALVEVKPVSEFHAATASRMRSACLERGIVDDVTPLLVGVGPMNLGEAVIVGWAVRNNKHVPEHLNYRHGFLAWIYTPDQPGIQADIWCPDPPYPGEEDRPQLCLSGLLTLGSSFELRGDVMTYPEHCMALWAEAGNRVQWQGPGQ